MISKLFPGHPVLFNKNSWKQGTMSVSMEDLSVVHHDKDTVVYNRHIIPVLEELPKKYKDKTLTQVDNILWGWFSKYIRLKYANKSGIVKCVTCGTEDQWNSGNIHAGHFIPRDRISTKYSEKNVHPQCAHCNKYRGGEQFLHGRYIDDRYGLGIADELSALGKKIQKFSKLELASLILYYSAKAKELAKTKGLKL